MPWHWWVGVGVLILVVLVSIAMVVNYLRVVVSSRYPPRAVRRDEANEIPVRDPRGRDNAIVSLTLAGTGSKGGAVSRGDANSAEGILAEGLKRARALPDESELAGRPPTKPSKHFAPLLVAGVTVALIITFVMAYLAGVFDKPSSEEEAKTLTAVLAFAGVLVAEAVVTVGLLVNHTIAVRSYELAVFEQDRLRSESRERTVQTWVNIAHQKSEAELADAQRDTDNQRLRADSIVAALGLMSGPTGQVAPSAQQAGAITALVELGSTDLAIGMLAQRWSAIAEPLTSSSAVRIIDHIVKHPRSTNEQRIEALSVLRSNAHKLWTLGPELEFELPPSLTPSADQPWPDTLPREGRLLLVKTMVTMYRTLAERNLGPWNEIEVPLILGLGVAFVRDPDEDIRAIAASLANALLPCVKRTAVLGQDFDDELGIALASSDGLALWETEKEDLERIGAWARQDPVIYEQPA